MPAGFDRWFRKATHRNASSRFSSAREMADALSPILRCGRAASVPERVETRIDSASVRANPSERIRAVARWVGATTLAWPSRLRVRLGLGHLVVIIAVVLPPPAPVGACGGSSGTGVSDAIGGSGGRGFEPAPRFAIDRSAGLCGGSALHRFAGGRALPMPLSAASGTGSEAAPAVGTDSAEDEGLKRLPERRLFSSAPTAPNRTAPNRPAAVDASPRPAVIDGDALFAERQ